MPKAVIQINNLKKETDYSLGETLLEIIKHENIFIDAPCGGKGKCGKCKVKFTGENIPILPEEKELNLNSYRLACMIKPSKDIIIEVPQEEKAEGFLISETQFDKRTEAAIKTVTKTIKAPETHENKSWLNKYEDAFGKINFEILKSLKTVSGNYTGVYLDKNLIAILDGDKNKKYAIAADIGTTTVAMVLIDVENMTVSAKRSFINPQIEFGSDVLTRISAALESEHNLFKMQDLIIAAIKKASFEMIDELQINPDFIYEIVFSANSVMNHILLGINPHVLGTAPYKNVFDKMLNFKSSEIGLHIGAHTHALIIPSVSSYIGADIVSGINFIEMEKLKTNTLFIDIGTNTELVLKHGSSFFATSCAAGPALEGMNITFGSRAQSGAVEDVNFDLISGNINLKVIGNTEPKTICGSGILALIRESLKAKLIDKKGRLISLSSLDVSDVRKKFLSDINGETVIRLFDKLYVSKKDIRNIQLSKTAILSGINILLDKFNLTASQLDEIIIAGQFGNHLTEDMLINTGFLPLIAKEKFSYMKNTSLDGAISAVLNINKRNNLMKLKNKIWFSDLSLDSKYQKFFMESSYFPDL
ncbi:ASKHA domain-containing protein [Treponema putidum]|uniref:ASKHA domain-containing protein n=1 Tax=Treponema putidum TaxID=221027 RepID=UPI003D8EDD59